MFDRDPRIPPLSIAFGFGPALLLLALAAAAWLLPAWTGHALLGAWLWGAAILLFLAGVARGTSFATGGAPDLRQVIRSIGLFLLGLAALASSFVYAFPLLALGYLLVGLFDPPEARRDRAPAHFARLRPAQAAMFVLALGLLAARVWTPG